MKKIFQILVVLLLTVNVASAYVESDELTQEEFIKSQGFSDEVVRLVDQEKSGRQNAKKQQNKFVTFVKKVFIYLDPYMDSEQFGDDNIDYSPKYDEI